MIQAKYCLLISLFFFILLYIGTANQKSKLCSWFQQVKTSTSFKKKKKKETKEKVTGQNQIEFAYILFFVVIAFEYRFLSFFNLWLSPYISIYHYIFVFICYPDFIYESCRQILWRAFLRCSEGKKGNQNWLGLLFSGRCGCQPTQKTIVTFQLIRFCYQGINTYSVFPCCCVAESDIFVPKLGFVQLQPGSSNPRSRTFTLACTPRSHARYMDPRRSTHYTTHVALFFLISCSSKARPTCPESWPSTNTRELPVSALTQAVAT